LAWRALGEHPAKVLPGRGLHPRHQVPVDVEGDLHRGVPEHLGDGVDVGAPAERYAREGVAEVVEPYVRQPDRFEQGLERAAGATSRG